MITQRRGTYKFPDDPSQFRKILMKYTLKCDPRTTQDKYACGEWDYLTYNVVYTPTGTYDSTYYEQPYFRIGWEAPDSLEYTSKQYSNTFRNYYYNRIISGTTQEDTFNIGSRIGNITPMGNKMRTQFIISSKELKDFGLVKGDISRISVHISQPGDVVYRVAIRMKTAPSGQLTSFVNSGFDTVYYSNMSFNVAGWQTVNLLKPFNWTGFSGLMFDISFELISGTIPPVIDGFANNKSLVAGGDDNYLYFDGVNDYVSIPNKLNAIYDSEQFTIEGWVKVNEWESWNRVFGNDKTSLVLGEKTGQLYCILRNPDNSNGNAQSAITLNDWYHVAMVYDGTKPTNEEKLKLFVNGQSRNLMFSMDIPSRTSNEDSPLSINGGYASNQQLKGGMDEVRIWNVALPDSIIGKWYNRKLNNSHLFISSLAAYYSFDKDSGTVLTDEATALYPGTLLGCPEWMNFNAMEIFKNPIQAQLAPVMKFMQGTYTSKLDSTLVITTKKEPPTSIIKYRIDDHKPVVDGISYVWKAGYSYTYNQYGVKTDSVFHPMENIIRNSKLKYYGNPFEVLYQWEIGRYITPYGINLDLGPDGFTWYYDVTDYAPLLKGNVDFSAGNQQELIDVKFLFIKGTPPRDVLSIKEPWGQFRSYSYKELSDDTKLTAVTVATNPDAKQFKLRTRFTGHGHNSNNGQYPHCCEWKDNTHYLLVNDRNFANWQVWQENDCAQNPVFPQGGTWPGSREGWCPGDVVKDHDFEITPDVINNEVKLDYDITKVPADNLGMGGGNYVVAMQLFEYGDYKFKTDVEVYNVVMPSNLPLYSRINPICTNPSVLVRNNGADTIKAINFKYSVSGGKVEEYLWKGAIAPNEKYGIILPVPGSSFWIGDGKNKFTVDANAVAMVPDENPENNIFTTDFNMPDLLPKQIIVEYKTNNRPNNYTYRIKDVSGGMVHTRDFPLSDRVYFDTLNLQEGCYTLELIDSYNMGLSYWANPDQGNGYMRLLDMTGKPIKTFNSDFGYGIYYAFNLGDVLYVQQNDENNYLEVFPNPAEGNLNIIVNYALGNALIIISDINGVTVHNESTEIYKNFNKTIQMPGLAPGIYFVRIQNDRYNIVKKFIKK